MRTGNIGLDFASDRTTWHVNVDRVYTLLAAKGIGFAGPPQVMPWGDRIVTTTDLEGRTVMLATKLPQKR